MQTREYPHVPDELVQLVRPRRVEQAVPGRRADAGDQAQVGRGNPEADGAPQRRQFGQRRVHDGLTAVVDGHDEEDGGRGQRRQDGLGSYGHEPTLMGPPPRSPISAPGSSKTSALTTLARNSTSIPARTGGSHC